MINNVVIVSGVLQSDLVIHIHVSILFQILFPYRLLQNIEYSSLFYTVGERCIFLNFVLEEKSFLSSFWKISYSEWVKNQK